MDGALANAVSRCYASGYLDRELTLMHSSHGGFIVEDRSGNGNLAQIISQVDKGSMLLLQYCCGTTISLNCREEHS